MPDEADSAISLKRAINGCIHRADLVLAQDVLVQFFILLGKDDVLLQEGENLRDGAKALHLGLQIAYLLMLPVEDIPPHRVPGHAIGKADGVGGGENLLRHEQFGRFTMVTTNLIYTKRYPFILSGVLAFDHKHRDAIDKENYILPRAIVAVVKRPFLGNLENVSRRLLEIDQDQVSLAVLLLVEELAPVAQQLHVFAVAVDVGAKIAKSTEQFAPGLGKARVEFFHLGVH